MFLCVCVCLSCMVAHDGWVLTTCPVSVCLPGVLPEEPVQERPGGCVHPERKAEDAQAKKSAQETQPFRAHAPRGSQNGLTPSPITHRMLFPPCLLVFPRSCSGLGQAQTPGPGGRGQGPQR